MAQKRLRGISIRGDTTKATHKKRRLIETTTEIAVQKVFSALLWLWGSNCFGQLGFGEDVMEQVRPALSSFTQKIVDVAVGGMHTIVLTVGGDLWSCGVNDEGALGRETSDDSEEATAETNPTIPGVIKFPEETPSFIQIACTDSGSFALTSDGSIFGWGTFRNDHGVLGFSSTVEKQLHPICVYHSSRSQSPAIKISSGGNHVVAVLQDGSAISWGDGDQGQLGRIGIRHSRRGRISEKLMLTPLRITGCRDVHFVDVFCGEFGTFLKTSEEQIFACGLNSSGQLAIPPAEDRSNEDFLTLERRVEKKITVLSPTLVESFSQLGIVEIAAGKDHSLGLTKEGGLYSWGAPTYGVLGRQDLSSKAEEATSFPTPVEVTGIDKKITAIAAGQVVSGCIDSDGDLYTWGANLNEMLGFISNDDVYVPKKVQRPSHMKNKKFSKLGFGGQHAMIMGN